MDEFDLALTEALNEAVPPADFETDLAGRLAARSRRRVRFWKLLLALGLFSAATAAMTPHAMCPRCRRYEPAVNEDGLCERCAAVMA